MVMSGGRWSTFLCCKMGNIFVWSSALS